MNNEIIEVLEGLVNNVLNQDEMGGCVYCIVAVQEKKVHMDTVIKRMIATRLIVRGLQVEEC